MGINASNESNVTLKKCMGPEAKLYQKIKKSNTYYYME